MIIILLIYVDDALFIGSNKAQLLKQKKKFMKQWKSCDIGEAKEYLGMSIIHYRSLCTVFCARQSEWAYCLL